MAKLDRMHMPKDMPKMHTGIMGNEKFNLGHEQTEMMMPMKMGDAMDKTMPMPTERTCDPKMNEDGGVHPWRPMGRK